MDAINEDGLKKRVEVLFLCTGAFVVLVYMAVLIRETANFPFRDDYDAILSFLNRFVEADFGTKLQLIASQHNEHRILIPRLFILAQYYLMGNVNFKVLVFMGSIGLFSCCILLWQIIKLSAKEGTPGLFIGAVTFIGLLNLRQAELVTWAMASLQQYWQMAFMLAAVYVLYRSRTWSALLLSLFFSTLAALTGGGGIVMFPLVLFILFIRKEGYLRLAFTFGIFLVFLLLYFVLLHYQKPANHPDILRTVAHWGDFLFSIFVFLGGLIPNETLAFTLGLLFTAFCVFHVSKRGWDSLAAVFLVALLTGGLASLTRGVSGTLASRYSPYSLLCLAVFIFMLNDAFPRIRNFFSLTLAGLMLLWGFGGIGSFNSMDTRSDKLLHSSIVYPDLARAKSILKESRDKSVFVFSKGEIETYPSAKDTGRKALGAIEEVGAVIQVAPGSVIDLNAAQSVYVPIKGWAVDRSGKRAAIDVILEMDGAVLSKLSYGLMRRDVAAELGAGAHTNVGFKDSIDISSLEKGKHEVKLRVIENGGKEFSYMASFFLNISR